MDNSTLEYSNTLYDVARYIPGHQLSPPQTEGEWWFVQRNLAFLDDAKKFIRPGFRHKITKTVITTEVVYEED
jgi:hypothetical protein